MNSPVCADASLIVRALVPGHFSQEAEALLATWQQATTPLIAPAYLALAQLSMCEFWTADRRLHNAVHQELAWVHLSSASGWIDHHSSSSNGESDI